MQTLKVIFLGTNLYYENPESMIKIYHENTQCENVIIKKPDYVVITKTIKNSPTKIKLLGIKNYSDSSKEIYFNEADSIIIFCDLENFESSKILSEMINYLKDNYNYGDVSALSNNSLNKKIYVLGKYQNEAEKDSLMSEESINNLLMNMKVQYDYMELCTKDPKQIVNTIDFIISETVESKNLLNKNMKKGNAKSESSVTSGGKCIIF